MEKVIGLAVEDGRQAMSAVREHAAEWGLDRGRIGALGFSAGDTLVSRLALARDPASRPDFVAPIYGAPGAETAILANAPPAFIIVCDGLAGDHPALISPFRHASHHRASSEPPLIIA